MKESEETEDRITQAVEYIKCPFCKEEDFDLEGLKGHFERGYCDVYNMTD